MPIKRKKQMNTTAAQKPQKPNEKPAPYFKMVADNRRARFDYEVLERVEAGVVLSGTEIKSVRAGKANIRDAYAQVRVGEMWLQNLHIAPWISAVSAATPAGWLRVPTTSNRGSSAPANCAACSAAALKLVGS